MSVLGLQREAVGTAHANSTVGVEVDSRLYKRTFAYKLITRLVIHRLFALSQALLLAWAMSHGMKGYPYYSVSHLQPSSSFGQLYTHS